MVYMLSHTGQPLMPTEDHRKVRLLLKDKKAKKDSGFGSEIWACEAEWDDAENSNNSMKGALYD